MGGRIVAFSILALVACDDPEPQPRSDYGCGYWARTGEERPDLFDTNAERIDNDGDGLSEVDGDCDDNNCNVHEFAVEVNNGLDDNCDSDQPPLYGCGNTTYDAALLPLLLLGVTRRRREERR